MFTLFFISCGQKGNHTGLVNTDYSLQKTPEWNIKFSEDDQAVIEKRNHRQLNLSLVKRTLKKNTTLIDLDPQISPKLLPSASFIPQITVTDTKLRDHQLNIPVVKDFKEDETGIIFILQKTIKKNLLSNTLDFCEMNNEENVFTDSFIFNHKISYRDIETQLINQNLEQDILLETNLNLCEKILVETYQLTLPPNENINLDEAFKKMGVSLKKTDYLHLTQDDSKAMLYRFHYLPLKSSLKIKERLTLSSLPVTTDMDLSHERLPALPGGHYQNISMTFLKPKKILKTTAEHIIEMKREIVYHESCAQSGERRSCEKGKLVETDIGPTITTQEEVIDYESQPLMKEEYRTWHVLIFANEHFARAMIEPLKEKSPNEIYYLKKMRSIHYPKGNKASGILENQEREFTTGPKLRLQALKTFHQIKKSERSYGLAQ